MGFDIGGAFDKFSFDGLIGEGGALGANIAEPDVEILDTNFTEGLSEKFDDGFLSSDDLDNQLESFWNDDKLGSLSITDTKKNEVNTHIKDKIWEQVGADNITEGTDLQVKEYEQKLSEGVFGDDEKQSITAKLETLKDTDRENDISFVDKEGELAENELKALDLNGDGKIDEKDGDFTTKGDEKGVINSKDKSVDARSAEAKAANNTEAGADKKTKNATMKKIMGVLTKVIQMMEAQQKKKAQQQKQQAQQQPKAQAPQQDWQGKTNYVYAQMDRLREKRALVQAQTRHVQRHGLG